MCLFGFLALRTERDTGSLQAIVGAAHIALGFRGFFLRYCHFLKISLKDSVFIRSATFVGIKPCQSLFYSEVFQCRKTGMKNRLFATTLSQVEINAA